MTPATALTFLAPFLPALATALAALATVLIVDAWKRVSARLDAAPPAVKQLVVAFVAPLLTVLAQQLTQHLGVPVPTSIDQVTTANLAPIISVGLALLLKRGQQTTKTNAVLSGAAVIAKALAGGDATPAEQAAARPATLPDPAPVGGVATGAPAADRVVEAVLQTAAKVTANGTGGSLAEVAGALFGLAGVLVPGASAVAGVAGRVLDAVTSRPVLGDGFQVAPNVPAYDRSVPADARTNSPPNTSPAAAAAASQGLASDARGY